MLMQTHLYQELPVYQDTQIGALKAIALKLTNDFNFDYQEVLSSLLASAGEQTQTINDQAILTYGHVTSLTEPVVIGFDFGKALPWAAGHKISQAIVLLVPVVNPPPSPITFRYSGVLIFNLRPFSKETTTPSLFLTLLL